MHTEYGGHDVYAWIFLGGVGLADSEVAEGGKTGGNKLCCGTFRGHCIEVVWRERFGEWLLLLSSVQ